jgi:hypothetical protein
MTNKLSPRLLPVFYSDNYTSVLPSDQMKIIIDCDEFKGKNAKVSINGCNTPLNIYRYTKVGAQNFVP